MILAGAGREWHQRKDSLEIRFRWQRDWPDYKLGSSIRIQSSMISKHGATIKAPQHLFVRVSSRPWDFTPSTNQWVCEESFQTFQVSYLSYILYLSCYMLSFVHHVQYIIIFVVREISHHQPTSECKESFSYMTLKNREVVPMQRSGDYES